MAGELGAAPRRARPRRMSSPRPPHTPFAPGLRLRQQIVKGSRRCYVDTIELAPTYILRITTLIEANDG